MEIASTPVIAVLPEASACSATNIGTPARKPSPAPVAVTACCGATSEPVSPRCAPPPRCWRPGPGRRPRRRRRPQKNAWVLLAEVAPELAEWATFFAAGAAKRAAAEAGSTRAVTEREADDLVRDADRFLAVVEQALGLAPHAPPPAVRHPVTRPPRTAARAG